MSQDENNEQSSDKSELTHPLGVAIVETLLSLSDAWQLTDMANAPGMQREALRRLLLAGWIEARWTLELLVDGVPLVRAICELHGKKTFSSPDYFLLSIYPRLPQGTKEKVCKDGEKMECEQRNVKSEMRLRVKGVEAAYEIANSGEYEKVGPDLKLNIAMLVTAPKSKYVDGWLTPTKVSPVESVKCQGAGEKKDVVIPESDKEELFKSLLRAHHKYDDGGVEYHEPIGVRGLAKKSGDKISPATSTRLFKKFFEDYETYKKACQIGNIHDHLRRLSGELLDYSAVDPRTLDHK